MWISLIVPLLQLYSLLHLLQCLSEHLGELYGEISHFVFEVCYLVIFLPYTLFVLLFQTLMQLLALLSNNIDSYVFAVPCLLALTSSCSLAALTLPPLLYTVNSSMCCIQFESLRYLIKTVCLRSEFLIELYYAFS